MCHAVLDTIFKYSQNNEKIFQTREAAHDDDSGYDDLLKIAYLRSATLPGRVSLTQNQLYDPQTRGPVCNTIYIILTWVLPVIIVNLLGLILLIPPGLIVFLLAPVSINFINWY